MPKVRVYYDGSGAIVGIEHRPDETYDDSNAAAYEGKTVTWNVVESAELDVTSAPPGGSPDASGKRAIVSRDDARDLSADRAALGAHLGDAGNPHHTTAAQVGALPANGGTVAGDLTVTGNVSLRGGSALFGTPNDTQTGFGNLQKKNVTLFLTGATQATVGTGAQAVLMIWPVRVGVTGLHIISSTGGVDSMTVGGTARFTGPKIGYVAHTFVNASGRILHTGDVVKLKASGAVRFHGDRNLMAIPEVTLADQAADPLVIGIVCQEATPAPDEPDRRSDPGDPTSIPDGGELFVVTLGTFAHCKADATEAPIQVGDLLTSSAKPGHARKATDPNVGCIIGKALEPLNGGTGYVAVFVNIQ